MSAHSAQVIQVCGAVALSLGVGELQSEGSGLRAWWSHGAHDGGRKGVSI